MLGCLTLSLQSSIEQESAQIEIYQVMNTAQKIIIVTSFYEFAQYILH